jgi:hypothetical protein
MSHLIKKNKFLAVLVPSCHIKCILITPCFFLRNFQWQHWIIKSLQDVRALYCGVNGAIKILVFFQMCVCVLNA